MVYLPDADAHGDSASQKNIATKELCDWLKAKLSKGKRPPPEKIIKVYLFNYFLASSNFYCLLIAFANSLDPDQGRHSVGPDLNPNGFTLGLRS